MHDSQVVELYYSNAFAYYIDQATEMINQVLKVFLLEDRAMDAELTKRALLKCAPNAVITVANGRKEFDQRIHWAEYDVMLADYHLPGFNGLEALLYVREHFPHLPFVFVTGQLDNEQKAAEAILRGANGYVLKEDLTKLENSICEAMVMASKKKKKADKAANKRQQRSLMLQKAMYLLNQAERFDEQEEIQEALKQAMQLD